MDMHSDEWERYSRGALDMIVHKVSKIDALVETTRRLESQQSKLESSIDKMTEAISRLTVIEERQTQDRKEMAELRSMLADMSRKHDAGMDRVMAVIGRVEERVDALEKAEPMNAQTRRWMIGAVTLLATIFIYALANLLGLKS